MIEMIMTAALIAAPAPTFESWISPETAAAAERYVIAREYVAYLDYDGDGELNISDVVSIRQRYRQNIKYGNSYTLTADTVQDIIEENYPDPPLQWEINWIDGSPARAYEVTADKIEEIHILFEFPDGGSDTIIVMLNPYEESATVL